MFRCYVLWSEHEETIGEVYWRVGTDYGDFCSYTGI